MYLKQSTFTHRTSDVAVPYGETRAAYMEGHPSVVWEDPSPSRRVTIIRWLELWAMCLLLVGVSWLSVESTKVDTTKTLETFMNQHSYTDSTRTTLKQGIHHWGVVNPEKSLDLSVLMDYVTLFHHRHQ